jgi:hypothetical protein
MTSLAEKKQTCTKQVILPDRWDKVFKKLGLNGNVRRKNQELIIIVKALLQIRLVSSGIDIDTLYKNAGRIIGQSSQSIKNAVSTLCQKNFPGKGFTEEAFISGALEKYYELFGLKETNSKVKAPTPKESTPQDLGLGQESPTCTSSFSIPSRNLPKTLQIKRAKELEGEIFSADDMRRKDGKSIKEIAIEKKQTEEEICFWFSHLLFYVSEDRAKTSRRYEHFLETGEELVE